MWASLAGLPFLIVGLVVCNRVAGDVNREYRARNVYLETECVVVAKRVGYGKRTLWPALDISLSVGEVAHQIKGSSLRSDGTNDGAKRVLARFSVGQRYPCWYDPDDPDKAVLERISDGGGAESLLGAVGALVFALLFLVSGLWTMVSPLRHAGKSREAILAEAIMARAPRKPRALATPYRARDRDAPASPLDGLPLPKVVTIAGSTLAVRLVRGRGRTAELGVLGLGTVVFNVIAVALLVCEVHVQSGILLLVLVPFALFAAYFMNKLVRRLVLFAVREPSLELDEHPIRIGRRVKLRITQRGPLRVNSICVLLRGVEEAISSSHNGTKTESKTFLEQEIFADVALDIERDRPWSTTTSLIVEGPAAFASPHNALRYELVVKTDIPRYPDDENTYPVLVLPQDATGDA